MNGENVSWMFELRLQTLLQYATTWKAVVLLDEADVFLEARQDLAGGSTDRKALVASKVSIAVTLVTSVV
jgi:hypothetical protein